MRRAAFRQSFLELRMFNIGEGEAVLVTFPNRTCWLFDAGVGTHPSPHRRLGGLLIDLLEANETTLTHCVASHPHSDHVGAFATIFGSDSPNIRRPLRVFRTDEEWFRPERVWKDVYHGATGVGVTETVIVDDSHLEPVDADSSVFLFAGSGQGDYTSLFAQIRFRKARILFTGDAECLYEDQLLQQVGVASLRGDVLKITHHGSSSGTKQTVVDAAIQPAICIASTAHDEDHTLEADTLQRLGGFDGPRDILETVSDGDLILRTDGHPYRRSGTLWDVKFDSPGGFAASFSNTDIVNRDDVQRRTGNPTHCG